MVMSWIFTGLIGISLLFSVFTGRGSALAAAIPEGAQKGFTLALSLAGSICLWSGLGKVMENAGITHKLTVLLRPTASPVPRHPERRASGAASQRQYLRQSSGVGERSHAHGDPGRQTDGGSQATPSFHGSAMQAHRAEYRVHPADPGQRGRSALKPWLRRSLRHPAGGMADKPSLCRLGADRRLGLRKGVEA